MQRVLVTGGAGYLGCLLVRELLRKDYRVRVIDSGMYGFESLANIHNHSNFESMLGTDIRDLTKMSKALEGVDHVIHLAGIVGAEASDINEIESTEINFIATRTLAELCELRKINLIFASTCSVYGAQPGEMLTEKSPALPQELYAGFKLKCEKAILEEHSSPCIFRFGTLFGASFRLRFDLVVNKFIAQALHHEKLTVFGGGRQCRPFLHVKDAVDGLIFAIEKNLDGKFNLISENHTLIDVATVIANLADTTISVTEENQDNRDYSVSMEKLSYYGFNPKRSIRYAFNEFAKYFDNHSINYKENRYSNVQSLKLKTT